MLNQKERNKEEETIPDRYIYEAVPELLGPGNHQQSPRIYVVELTEKPNSHVSSSDNSPQDE